MAKIRDIARILSKTQQNNPNNLRLLSVGETGGIDSATTESIAREAPLKVYATLESLPTSDLTAGDQAWVVSNNRLYISNGSGWYNIAATNATPYWQTEPNASYEITDSATPLVITALAADSDNSDQNLLHQSTVSDSAAFLVDITRDSSVFTFTPKSQDSIGASVTAGDLTDSNTNDFIYTFKWSDGINFISKAVTINYNFLTDTFISATGGTVTTSGDYRFHRFTTTGNSSFVVSSIGTGIGEPIDYLVIAGGGGGGYASNLGAGGGGAGGLIHHTDWTGLAAQTYTITVGAGGTARNNGSNSSAFGNTALGGGKGGSDFSNGFQGGDGGSGGGSGVHSGGQDAGSALSQTTISGATAYGSAGGLNYQSSPYYAGGGGGAGGVGGNGTSTAAGDGGAGLYFATWAAISGVNGYFAGGGGAGAPSVYGGSDIGTAGWGGGLGGANGQANTGGGGGGGNTSGGSGVVIIRYRFQ